jgi:RHS repeat-associated protein
VRIGVVAKAIALIAVATLLQGAGSHVLGQDRPARDQPAPQPAPAPIAQPMTQPGAAYAVEVTPDNQLGETRVRGTSGNQVTFTVRNVGTNPDSYTLDCAACSSLSATSVSLNPWDQIAVVATFSTPATGTGSSMTVTLDAMSNTDDLATDQGSYTVPLLRAGGAIATHIFPGDSARVINGDSLFADFSHPTGVNTSTAKFYLDGSSSAVTGTVWVGTKLVKRNLSLSKGTHTWKSKACSSQGWCDSTITRFTVTDGPAWFAMDDSLPPATGAAGVVGLLGPLPLPPDSLRGCPRTTDSPEIRIESPSSYILQPGSTAYPGGLIFAASIANAVDTMRVSTVHVDHTPSQGVSCATFGYLDNTQFDWTYWTGVAPHDTLWSGYPYSDRTLLGAVTFEHDEAQLAMADELLGLGRPVHGPNPGAAPDAAMRQGTRPTLAARATGVGLFRRLTMAARRLPDPGAIRAKSFKLTLNGVLIVSDSVGLMGVRLASLERYGSTVHVPVTMLNKFNPLAPTANNGGWNELVASISDSGGRTTMVRSRFPYMDPGPIQPVQLATLRDFSHLEQGDCAAFGLFQCGGVTTTVTIPGLVTRDKDRSLHVVYRSASQRVPTILPVQVSIARTQRAPDSIRVQAKVNGAVAGSLLRYAGRVNAPSGPGSMPLMEDANETRILGAELDADTVLVDGVKVRNVTIEVTSFYGTTPQSQTISQDVVQAPLLDTTTTRFGAGWQLAELGRLSFGHTFGGAPAAVWLRGDGSWAVYRLVAGAWQPPAGETARLLDSTTTPGLAARWGLALENGAMLGFGANGWQRYSEDLLGNRTTFEYASSSQRLVGVWDATRRGYRFTYNTGSAAVNAVSVDSMVTPPSGSYPALQVTTLAYGGTAKSPRLTQATTTRGGTSDVTGFFYASWAGADALLDSIVDPRSTTAKPMFVKLTYDAATRLPEAAARANGDLTTFRDPWRRAVPRINYGRGTYPLERLPQVSQVQGTWQRLGQRPMDTRVDAFGAPLFVREVSREGTTSASSGGGFLIPSSSADYERYMERDAAGRVTKIADARAFAEMADSVRYKYDALGRIIVIYTTTLGTGSSGIDSTTFTYDVVELGSSRWCSRMTSSTDVLGYTTTYQYGTSGVASCLTSRVIGPANDTTSFTYGTLAAGAASATRPVEIRDAVGQRQVAIYDPTTWNTSRALRLPDSAGTKFYYDRYGRPDSILDPANTPTRFQRDNTGRVLKQRTGRGTVAMTATTYDAGGQVTQVDIGASTDASWTTHLASPAVQTTRYFYSQLGYLDSTLYPGSRTATGSNQRARKLSYLRSADGLPRFEFPGNGSYLARQFNDRGQPLLLEQGRNDGNITVDGERFADDAAKTFYMSATSALSSGPQLHAGGYFRFRYDNKGREVWSTGYDNFRRTQYVSRLQGWTRQGALLGDTLDIDNAVRMSRRYEYNKRGQRTRVVDQLALLDGTLLGGTSSGEVIYTYDPVTGWLSSMEGKSAGVPFARARYAYDKIGREIWRSVWVSGTDSMVTTRLYDNVGRLDSLVTRRASGAVQYNFKRTASNATDDLLGGRVTAGSWVASHTLTLGYSTDGLRRLVSLNRTAPNLGQTWSFDVFGNAIAEYTWSTGAACQGTDSIRIDADNRVVRRWPTGCPLAPKRFYHDQAGRRLGQADTLQGGATYRSSQTYTSAGQLYYAVSPWLHDLIHHDHAWNWYGPDGYRLKTTVQPGASTFAGVLPDGGVESLYFYDGADIAVTVRRVGAGSYRAYQRFLNGGVDQQLAVRLDDGNPRSLLIGADYQGNTVRVIRSDLSTVECDPSVTLRGAYGAAISPTQPGCSETGFTGASTPTPSGGFTYLRNRWYDPQTGRFLTQDPIGLAGGINLYAYAGANPASFSDSFGLCPDGTTAGRAYGIGLRVVIECSDGTNEIRSGGSRSWRNNNPGNLRNYDFSKRHGSIGEAGSKATGDFAVFPDVQTGQAARAALLRLPKYGALSLTDAIKAYAPSNENDVEAYIASLERQTGISRDAVLGQLSDARMHELLTAMQRHEGFEEGQVRYEGRKQ